ncbi:Methionine synthase OS=Castellaniella defragrans OX=75697 GN=HNR28_001472 PE=3 SV=1 [Castellaniella denitrificans]
MQLTEAYAMMPGHPASAASIQPSAGTSIFNVGNIGADQVADYVRRTGRDEEDVRRTLASVLR